MNTILQDSEAVWPDIWPQNKCRSLWPIFHGPVILPYILKTIWCMNTILWDYESVWPDVWPKNKCRSLWPIFHGPVILPYILKAIWCVNTIIWDYESVWPQNKCRSLWPIFHGQVILPYILKTIWYMNTILWDMSQYSPMFDLKINVGHCDLYFMVQWFCLISWRLFNIWTPYFGIMSQYDPMFDLKIYLGHCDLYFMVQWFCLISWRLFDIWTPYFGIMSQYDLMFNLKVNVGHRDLYFIVHWFCLISLYLMDECHTFGKWVRVIWSSDLSFFNICSEKHFSFIGKALSGELWQLLFFLSKQITNFLAAIRARVFKFVITLRVAKYIIEGQKTKVRFILPYFSFFPSLTPM